MDYPQDSNTARERCLEAATEAVMGDRNREYGDPEDDFSGTARMWDVILKNKLLPNTIIEPHEVAAMMIAVKLSRIRQSPDVSDHWIDIAGYAACGMECSTKRAFLDPTHHWPIDAQPGDGDYDYSPMETEAAAHRAWGDERARFNEEKDNGQSPTISTPLADDSVGPGPHSARKYTDAKWLKKQQAWRESRDNTGETGGGVASAPAGTKDPGTKITDSDSSVSK